MPPVVQQQQRHTILLTLYLVLTPPVLLNLCRAKQLSTKSNPYPGNNQYRCNAAFTETNRSKSMPLRRFTLYLESVNNVDI